MPSPSPFLPLLLLSSLVPAVAQEPTDAPDKTPSDFVRFVKEGDGGHLDTAITTYTKDGVTLVLFGAVHIADGACYAKLNDRFTQCDVLLYELVAPPDTRPDKNREREGFNPLSMLQNGLKNSMELTFQLDEVDYQAKNFVHADMSPAEFARSMAERGESLLSIMFDMMMGGMERQAEKAEKDAAEGKPQPELDLVKAFRGGEGRHTLRMAFAQQMEDIEVMMAGGKTSTLLEGRNEKCLEVLEREIKAGHKTIGIYYGAAHFPHMEKRIVDDLGFKKTGHEWLVAWDCKKRPDVKYDRALVKLRQKAKADLGALALAAREYRFGGMSTRALPTPAEISAEKGKDGAPLYTGPTDDPWGKPYVVRKRSIGARWEVVSGGQDGTVGTADDLVVVEPRRGGLLGG
ncbi:MAG: type II secretion system protein GspG [Planctomycetes bacterium]|nr:type II secretion system protein GspG [Planctomycetota bacterium]